MKSYSKYYDRITYFACIEREEFYFTCFRQGTPYGFRTVCYTGEYDMPPANIKPIAKSLCKTGTDYTFSYRPLLEQAINKLDTTSLNKWYLYESLVKLQTSEKDKPHYIPFVLTD